MYDLILAHGTVYDGSGTLPKHQDIGIRGDRIIAVGDLADSYSSCNTIDVEDLAVSPGFIDVHSHSDVYYLVHPQAESKVRQGVTTEVIGNCGGSAAPLYGSFRKKRRQEWEKIGVEVTWSSFKEYIDILHSHGIAVNVVPLIGYGNIRGGVKGFSRRSLTKQERLRVHKLLCRELEHGAWGLSTGLIYTPCMYADTEELVDIVRIVAEYKGVYTTHIRGEGDSLIEALEEAIDIARETGVNLQISHLKTAGSRNWKKLSLVFKIIEEAIQEGIRIGCDRYPYIASNTDLDILLPEWFNKMSEKRRRYWLEHHRDRLIDCFRRELEPQWPDEVWIGRVSSSANRAIQGLSIREIARKRRKSPEEVALELIEEDDFNIQAIFFNMNEENLLRILERPYVMIGSDSSLRTIRGPLAIGHPHPRTFGTFPRLLSRYTGEGRLSISEAIMKMTAKPAEKIGLKGRGRIKEGMYADLVVFNLQRLRDRATYEKPFQYPEGIKYVLVNGEFVLKNGRYTGKLPGRVLLRD